MRSSYIAVLIVTAALLPARASAQGTGNAASDILASLPPKRQAELLGKFISKGGEDQCDGITAFYQGQDADKDAFWNVLCRGGKSYGVMMKPDAGGTTTYADCAELRVVGDKCFTKF